MIHRAQHAFLARRQDREEGETPRSPTYIPGYIRQDRAPIGMAMRARKKILIIDAHPDADPAHFVHALADAYANGAKAHQVRRMMLAGLDFPMLRRPADWLEGAPPS